VVAKCAGGDGVGTLSEHYHTIISSNEDPTFRL
jgi:hypothetical protein